MISTTEKLRHQLEFALANITGDGFGGDYGYKSVGALAAEAGEWLDGLPIPMEIATSELDQMVAEGKILYQDGRYSNKPVQCVKCGDNPCTCGIGTWR